MRWLAIAAAAIVLSGCGLPTIVSVWSTALDFASYGSTGKTVTDHGLSLVLQQDCALLRGLEGEVCVEEGSEHASKKPVKEPETSASRRFAYLEEEANRGTARYPVEPDDSGLLRSAFATDPGIQPGSTPATANVATQAREFPPRSRGTTM